MLLAGAVKQALTHFSAYDQMRQRALGQHRKKCETYGFYSLSLLWPRITALSLPDIAVRFVFFCRATLIVLFSRTQNLCAYVLTFYLPIFIVKFDPIFQAVVKTLWKLPKLYLVTLYHGKMSYSLWKSAQSMSNEPTRV